MIDPKFIVTTLAATPNPQINTWRAMHQDYSEKFVGLEPTPSEGEAGAIAVKRLLNGERGHYGPLEHSQITLAVGYFPHSVMQQARTHRVGVSFDVQSMRYTGSRIVEVADMIADPEDVFYLRPVGDYVNRDGHRYFYSEQQRQRDLSCCFQAATDYKQRILEGYTEEHARGLLPFDYRQHFVFSLTMRAFMHFLDLRAKLDAQEEIRHLCDLMFPLFEDWSPQIAEWYKRSRLRKARLSP
jgi:thymidylate synthase (FAD)